MRTLKGAIILNIIASILFLVNVAVAYQAGESIAINAALAFFFLVSAFFYWRRLKKRQKD